MDKCIALARWKPLPELVDLHVGSNLELEPFKKLRQRRRSVFWASSYKVFKELNWGFGVLNLISFERNAGWFGVPSLSLGASDSVAAWLKATTVAEKDCKWKSA